jgi:hypothetical protein
MPPGLVLAALFAPVDPSERLFLIGVIVLCLAMLFGARVSGGFLGRHENASQRYLLGWLGHTVEGASDIEAAAS